MVLAEGDDFERRLLMSVDAKGYGGGTDRRQGIVQDGLLNVLDDAAERAGLARPRWHRQGAGDGELAILPPGEPEPRVVDDFVRHLQAALRRYNRDWPAGKRLRLRLAIHFGAAIPAANGYRGKGPVVVNRLCDSQPLRETLAASGADLAVIVSQQIFTDTVMQEHTSLEPDDFRRVRITNKEYDEDAWIWVPGHNVHDLDLPDDEDTLETPPPNAAGTRQKAAGAGQNVHNTFYKPNVQGSVFGFGSPS